MDIGLMRSRVQLQTPIDSVDVYGQPQRAWVTYATVWANIQEISSAETVVGPQLAEGTTIVITIRYLAQVKAFDRVVTSTGRVLGLTGKPINPDLVNRFHVLGCREWKD